MGVSEALFVVVMVGNSLISNPHSVLAHKSHLTVLLVATHIVSVRGSLKLCWLVVAVMVGKTPNSTVLFSHLPCSHILPHLTLFRLHLQILPTLLALTVHCLPCSQIPCPHREREGFLSQLSWLTLFFSKISPLVVRVSRDSTYLR